MIPGAEPVSTQEEAFSFEGEPDGPKKSKFFFDAGTYVARAVSIVKGVSKAGNPQFTLTLVGLSGPARGIEFRTWLPIAGKAVFLTERKLKAFGITKNKETNTFNFKPSDILNKEVGMVLIQEQYDGKDRMSVENLVPVSEVPGETTAATDNSNIPF